MEPKETADESTERLQTLNELDDWLRRPMLALSFAWLVLVVAELAWGTSRLLEVFGTAIWVIFLLEFALRIALAPDKLAFLRANWLSALALLAPALRLVRVLRVLRFARLGRGLRLFRIVGTANRGMRTLRASMGRRRLGYVLALTCFVALLGAGGMLAFEPASEVEGGFTSYADALWWTGMLLTSLGSEFWPRTLEGTAPLLSAVHLWLRGIRLRHGEPRQLLRRRDAAAPDAETAGARDMALLRAETVPLRTSLEAAAQC